MIYKKYILQAIQLAKKGHGFVSPNPVVGAVIVKNGKVIGEGFHEKFGENHAEKNAIIHAEKNGYDVSGGTIFVTLEPCAHTGKTPSCAHLLVEKKIKKVVIVHRDPNPKAGGGIEILKNTGIEVEVLEEWRELQKNKKMQYMASQKGIDLEMCSVEFVQKAREINKGFFSVHEKNRPFFTAKVAVSNNGMVTEKKGKRTQISGKQAGKFTQQLRKECDGILVGANTGVVDNPFLSIREKSYTGKQPLRICIDPNHRISKNANIFRDDNILLVDGKINLHQLSEVLKNRGILRVLIEGGPKTLEYFLKENLIDELYMIQSKKNLSENGVKLFPHDMPKNMTSEKKWQCGEDTITRYIFEV